MSMHIIYQRGKGEREAERVREKEKEKERGRKGENEEKEKADPPILSLWKLREIGEEWNEVRSTR